MTGSEPRNCDIDAQPSQMPAESLSGTSMRAGETDGLPESMTISNQETESGAKLGSQSMIEAATESATEKATEEETEQDEVREEEEENTPAPPVLYKVQYLNTFDDIVFTKESKEPLGIQNTLSALGKSIIEVITDFRIHGSYEPSNSEKEEPGPHE